MRHVLTAIAGSIWLAACSVVPADNGANNTFTNETIVKPAVIDAALADMVEDGRVAGVSAIVFEDGEEVYFGAFGDADREAGTPMQRDTIVQIFSMTKPVAGVALMTLYEQGLFEFDDPIAEYVPEMADLKLFGGLDANGDAILLEPTRQPTVMDFLRHTAGLKQGADDTPLGQMYAEVDATNIRNTLPELAEKLGSLPLLYNPGEQWQYSAAVDIQALMVERLSGEPFDSYVQRVVLDPLGMTETGYFIPEARRDRVAARYETLEDGSLRRVDDAVANEFNFNRWPLTPGSFGFASTLDDYSRFARMLLNEGEFDGVRILQPETIDLMSTNYLDPAIEERLWLPSKGQVGFGIDFAVRTDPPASRDENFGYVGEFFWDGYASTMFWVDPQNDLTSVFFVQNVPFNNAAHKIYRDAVYDRMDRSQAEE